VVSNKIEWGVRIVQVLDSARLLRHCMGSLLSFFAPPFCWLLKVHKIEIFFGFDFEICIISLLVMSKY
jgi:hypothetical protein